ncbi:MAG: 4Fe-4S dicluster domain-containing protein [Dehalococcoidia bacterium]|jgi:molybdopterin-containing oxidoreductase family iron-sulfur binding subunit|nr:4Fe-4S dicluster domain-containing protein [Dehalococcoidia bacterium]
MRYVMVIDLKRCIGCYGCQIACKSENATPPGVFWARVLKQEAGKFPNVRRSSLPLLCMHCQDPACQQVCPTGATTKSDNGIVEVDSDECVGCRYCMMACPYGARYFNAKERSYFGQGLNEYEKVGYPNHPTGVVGKCDFCRHRLEKKLEPACVANCMARARYFGDVDDPNSEVSHLIREKRGQQLHPELGTDPSVYYLPA